MSLKGDKNIVAPIEQMSNRFIDDLRQLGKLTTTL
jgi:hypothetical protein